MKSFIALTTRRAFLERTAAAGAALGLGSLLPPFPRVSAAEATLDSNAVQFTPDIEPLVRFIEEAPRPRLLEEMAHRIQHGLSYREVLAALLLAGIRNIQPRPVGFKFHAVLVVNSAHLASLSSADADRWLPIFWALDYFKASQARDIREGDWTMRRVDEKRVPSADQAAAAFTEAMENWDVEAADAATAGLARSAGAAEVFDLFCRFGARDYRDIGHKAIYVANAWRTLGCIGWRHAEPVLRSLAYALLAHEGGNPSQRDDLADRSGRKNLALLGTIREGWQAGAADAGVTQALLGQLRTEDPDAICAAVISHLNKGIAPAALWDALFAASSECLMRRPGILSLHAVTTTNAMHYAFQTAPQDDTRKYLLLQNAAFLPMFRGSPQRLNALSLDGLGQTPEPAPSLEAVFAEISASRSSAAQLAHRYLASTSNPGAFIQAARKYIFLKGSNSHDYKFSSAVLEDYPHLAPGLRDRFLAASVFNLRGSADADNGLVERIRAAFS